MKKRVLKIVVIVLAAVLLLEGISIAVSCIFASRDKEWGLKLSASDVSSKGLTLTMERNNSQREEDLTVGSDYWVQRKTLFGWKGLEAADGGIFFDAIGYPMNEGDSQSFKVNWENYFGRLWPGVYRIYKNAVTDGQTASPTVYATFFVLF